MKIMVVSPESSSREYQRRHTRARQTRKFVTYVQDRTVKRGSDCLTSVSFKHRCLSTKKNSSSRHDLFERRATTTTTTKMIF